MAHSKMFTNGGPKYDWGRHAFVEDRKGVSHRIERDRRWELLIFPERTPHMDVDPGITYSDDVFKNLYEKGKLTGRALVDAQEKYV
jgi:hypothetical protein